ncbi:B-cell receptor CD22-like [Trichomycterus rosablanca]|uniref:B-cell receptor CD22-like n=1 Tax=Trichomycterus rosablanca TaxID=2290929 RepID=UPI002F35BDB4
MEYKGRVTYIQNNQNKCGLRIDDLRESDAGTYKFRFYTQDPTGKYTGEPGVTLSVTDLKVTESNNRLTCTSTCTLLNPTYIWYRNGQTVVTSYRNQLNLYNRDAGSYSCAIRKHENLRSTALCVWSSNCWTVSFLYQTMCALVGSSVDINGYYTFPDRQYNPRLDWYKQDDKLSPANGRVEFLYVRNNQSTLRLNNVTVSDSARYKLTVTAWNSKASSFHSVSLSVTDLSVTIPRTPSHAQKITLRCTSSCNLHNKPTYIWYQNGRHVTGCESAFCTVAAANGAVSYSCAVKGHENLLSAPVYTAKNTSAAVLPSNVTVEGKSVTLTCSSLGANPPIVKYFWFKQEANANREVANSQKYSIANVSSGHRGFYYCSAHNQLGQQISTPTHLDVLYSPQNTSAVVISSKETAEGSSVTLICSSQANPPVLTYRWFKQEANTDVQLNTDQNYTITNISSQHSGFYYCSAHNQQGQQNSTPTHLDVLYAPRIPLLTTFRSASGNSITMHCQSDANPTSSYSWYRKTGGDVIHIGNGTNVTLDAGDAGVYYCTARNQLGSLDTSEWSARKDNHAKTYTALGCTMLILLIIFAAVLWTRRSTICAAATAATAATAESSNTTSKNNSSTDHAAVYANISDMNSNTDDQAEILYSSVRFTRNQPQNRPLYSTLQMPNVLEQEGEVQYAVVSLTQPRAAQSDAIYSTAQRT